MQSKVLLGPAPELPHALKCCSGLLRSRLCTRNGCLGKPQSCQVARKACPRQLRNRIASNNCADHLESGKGLKFKVLLEIFVRKGCSEIAWKLLFESTARNYCSKTPVSATPYSHPLPAVPLAKCMECTGSH